MAQALNQPPESARPERLPKFAREVDGVVPGVLIALNIGPLARA